MKRLSWMLLMLMLAACVPTTVVTPTVSPVSPTVKTTDATAAATRVNSPQEIPYITVTATTKFEYIGLEYPPLPEYIDTSSSWSELIPFPASTSSDPWSVNIVRDNRTFMLWLSKRLFVDINGKAHWRVSDVVILPDPEADWRIIASACLLKGVLDPEIVVLAQIDDTTSNSRYLLNQNIIMAWKANRIIGKLVSIETSDIECYADTFLSYP